MSWSEAKWVVDQIVRKTGRAPNNMRAFSVLAASETSAALRFLEPEDSYDAVGNLICSVGGVMVRMSTEGYPAFVNDGTLVVNNASLGAYENTPFVVTGLTAGTKYYFSAFPYSSQEVFNLSSAGANRAECVPAGVEQVNVSVTIDDDSGFIPTVVTCVNETDPTATKTAAITAAKRACAFAVPAGDTYHIEYGSVTDYAAPDSTASKTAAAGAVSNYTGAYSYFTATIAVSCPVGAELTCTRGDVSYKATASTGSHTFTVHQAGDWTILAVSGEEAAQTAVTISASGEAKTASLAFFRSTIAVTYPAGSYLTCSCGEETLAADTSGGTYTFTVRKAGAWVVKATDGVKSDESSVVIAASGEEKSVALTYFRATISVTYPQGCTLTCTKGDTVLTASGGTGSYQFVVREAGEWTVKTSDGTREAEKAVSVTDGQTVSVTLEFIRVYGVSHTVSDGSSTWTRTDDAVGRNAFASVGDVAGHSDFDNCYPWSEMQRETLSTGDVMVKIPKFWYQRAVTDGVERIRIADRAMSGFEKHPGSGLYVGAYKTSSDSASVTGAAPTVSQTRAVMRNNARSKGIGWGLIDASANSALQMLFQVEYASSNGQAAIGRGYCDDNTAVINTGSCDSVPGLTGRPAGTDGKVDVVYRGIEGIWGNVSEWMDGLNASITRESSGFITITGYVSAEPDMYADGVSAGYAALSHELPYISGSGNKAFITQEGLSVSVPWAMLPSSVSGGSETAFYPDTFYSGLSPNAGATVKLALARSGCWKDGSGCGPFCLSCYSISSPAPVSCGSRLLYRPPQA